MSFADLTLVLGGARSGKSRYGEALISKAPAPWFYLATARVTDDEMRERIDSHRARRGDGWQTVEAPVELGEAMASCPLGAPVLVDCLTIWMSNLLIEERSIGPAVAAFEGAIADRHGPTVLVSNEVGMGIVPENALARRFRDEVGWLHQRLAAQAGEVCLMVAGLPVVVKARP